MSLVNCVHEYSNIKVIPFYNLLYNDRFYFTASNYMDKIKNLKKKMNSKGAKKEKKSDKAI